MLRVLALAAAMVASGQRSYQPGVFVGTSHGPIELTAYAEVVTNGQLRMAKGSFENVPTVSDVDRILCNIPNWQPGSIMMASDEIFSDHRAERREVPFAIRRVNISAIEVRVENLERRDRLEELIRSVRRSDTAPAYVFVVMATNGLSRFYPFKVRLD